MFPAHSVYLSLSLIFSFSSVSHHNNVIPTGFTNPSGSFVCRPGNLTLLVSVLWFSKSVRIEGSFVLLVHCS
jgi:hypothetical protein